MARTCVAALLLLVASVDGKARPITTPGDGCLSRLNRGHETTLDKGKPVMFAGAMGGEGGRGTAVCDVAAPPRVVWKLLTDFEHYAGKLPNCKSCKVYSRSKNMVMRTERIKVHMQLDAVVRSFNCYYDHTYAPDKKMLTWTLDPAHTSDFTDVQGQWYIDKHPSKKDCSRVWYTAEVALPPWLPAMMVKRLCNEAGKKSVGFVKKYAEKDWEKEQASAGGMWAKMKAPTEKYKAEMKALTEKMTILEKYEVWRLGYNLDATWLPLLDATKAETKAFTEKYKAEMKALTEKYKAEMKATEKYKAEMKKATAAMSKKADGPN